jgi:hypothetical protein
VLTPRPLTQHKPDMNDIAKLLGLDTYGYYGYDDRDELEVSIDVQEWSLFGPYATQPYALLVLHQERVVSKVKGLLSKIKGLESDCAELRWGGDAVMIQYDSTSTRCYRA